MEQENQIQISEKKSKPNLINAIQAGNKFDINQCLREFKTEQGLVDFNSLFAIPSENRLPKLFKDDPAKMVAITITGLTISFESMNLSRGMNANQILDLAETILESSNEDNLALEDLMLFLQKLVRGELGKLYESMDIPKFMEMFEVYREERFQAMKKEREEQAVQHKTLPINERLIDMFGDERGKHREALKDYLITKNKSDVSATL